MPHARIFLSALSLALPALLMGGSASALSQTYLLSNHPDGNAQLPRYGLRLDELFDPTGSHDVFTFSFDEAASDMQLTFTDDANGDTIPGDYEVHIFGSVFGGLDTGSAWGDPLYAGVWSVDFRYTQNFSSIGPGGTQIEVAPDAPFANNGTITPQFAVGGDGSTNGVPINIFDYQGSEAFSFRFNNTDDHRLGGHGLSGPETFVGWGWLQYDDSVHISDSDWLFIGVVPEPGTGLMVMLGLCILSGRRARNPRRPGEASAASTRAA